ncbi:MAG: Gfo/Idh/MocA family oxidoreductase [Candidatus Omnitrophota bacterium]
MSLPEAIDKTLNWHKQKRTPVHNVDLKESEKKLTLDETISVGIVGCGQIIRAHLPALKAIQGINIVGICDVNIDSAKKLAVEFGISDVYPSLEAMLKEKRPNVVHILTPPQVHKDLAIYAMESGCNVLVEKPMALNAQEAEIMLKVAEENKVKLGVVHNLLYEPVMIAARKMITEGRLGDIVYVESWYGSNLGSNLDSRYMTPGAKDHWALTLPGSLYQNLMPHPLCLLMDIIGRPDKLHVASSHTGTVKAMESDELRVMTESKGKLGLISISLAVSPRYQFFNIYGTKMSLRVDFLNKTLIRHGSISGMPSVVSRALMNLSQAKTIVNGMIRNVWQVSCGKFTPYEGTRVLIKEFYKAVAGKGELPVSGKEGLENMEVMDKVWQRLKGE